MNCLIEQLEVTYIATMKRAEVQLPDGLYQQVEGLAGRLQMSVSELLSQAAEQMILRQAKVQPKPDNGWKFPESRHLGSFQAHAEDWRLLANETTD
jgi:hypothetical protein